LDWQPLVVLISAILIAYVVVLWLGTIVWLYRDIRERTRDGWTQAVAIGLVVLFNLPGLLVYLLVRPGETLTEAYERRLEAEALMRDLPEPHPTCPNCGRSAHENFLLCPYCRTRLRQPCKGCGQPLELAWVACPFCGADGPQAAAAAAERAAAAAAPPPAAEPPVPVQAPSRPEAARPSAEEPSARAAGPFSS
jgi:hypothetical protein